MSSNPPPFHSSPQKFAKSRNHATMVTQSLINLMRKGPRTIIGTIADTSFHLTQQYVTCTTQLGIVQVYGVPLGSVVPGMRVYCRQIGGMASNRSFVYDGMASAIASLGPHGSLMIAGSPIQNFNTGYTTAPDVSATVGITGPVGYYWHFFFYVPSVPTSPVTIMEMSLNPGVTTFLRVQLLPSCLLQVIDNTGHGYITNTPVTPHSLHWVLIQPGHNGGALMVDDIANYTGILTTNDAPVFTGNTSTYTLWLGSTGSGTQILPVGSWISKFGFGSITPGFLVIPSPAYDTDIPNGNSGPLSTKVLYLFEDEPGSAEAKNSAVGVTTGTLTLFQPATIVSAGPY